MTKETRAIYTGRSSKRLLLSPLVQLGACCIILIFLFLISLLLMLVAGFNRDIVSSIFGFLALPFVAYAMILPLTFIFYLRSWLAGQYLITDKRACAKGGLMVSVSTEIPLTDIRNVAVFQTWVGKILGIGSLLLIGQTKIHSVPIKNVRDPHKLKLEIERARECH